MQKLINWLASVRKTLVGVGNFLVALATVTADGKIEGQILPLPTSEWLILVTAFVAIFGIYQVSNLVGSVNRKK